MKLKLILLVLLSLIVGVPTNLEWFTLYGTEFPGPISEINAGTLSPGWFILWIVLLFFHLWLICLFFLTKKDYFTKMMLWVPLLFVFTYAIFDLFALFFLIPFIILWIIILVKQRRTDLKTLR